METSHHSSFIRPDELWHELGLRAGQTVVHLGSGPGFFLLPAAKIVGKSGKAIGVDILTDMLSEVEGRAKREGVDGVVHTIRANLEHDHGSTLDDASTDWVLVANIMHQSDPKKILSEARRIIKGTGSLAIVEWDVGESPLGPPPEQRLAKRDAQKIAESSGFALKEEWQPSPYHYGLLMTPA